MAVAAKSADDKKAAEEAAAAKAADEKRAVEAQAKASAAKSAKLAGAAIFLSSKNCCHCLSGQGRES